jgi:tetratricopeptide (TPR) repeat protein
VAADLSVKNTMTCAEIDQNDIMEQYLLGRLQVAARDEFDQHLFECDDCFDRLQTLRALRRELTTTAAALRAQPVRATRRWTWTWALAPALAVVVIVVSVSVWPRALPPSVEEPATSTGRPPGGAVPPEGAPPQALPATVSLAELGRIQPPPFAAGSLRGIDDAATARFRDAMKHYAGGDFRGAIPGLRAAARLDPEAAHATFFLGVCYVLAGQLDEGIRALRQTIDVGDSPYLEEAHFYLAKALLQNNDPAGARQEVERTIRLGGTLDNQARQLLAALNGLGPRRP